MSDDAAAPNQLVISHDPPKSKVEEPEPKGLPPQAEKFCNLCDEKRNEILRFYSSSGNEDRFLLNLLNQLAFRERTLKMLIFVYETLKKTKKVDKVLKSIVYNLIYLVQLNQEACFFMLRRMCFAKKLDSLLFKFEVFQLLSRECFDFMFPHTLKYLKQTENPNKTEIFIDLTLYFLKQTDPAQFKKLKEESDGWQVEKIKPFLQNYLEKRCYL